MAFILSKILLFILWPLYWVFALLLFAFFTKKPGRKRKYLIAAITLLYFFTIPFFLKLVEFGWDIKPYPANDVTKYSCVIVLGGFSADDGNGDGYFNTSADRFIQGVKLIETKQVSHILITGGNGELVPGKFREATWVKTQLSKFNIPDSLILIEYKSKNTIENARFSKTLLEKTHLRPPYLLVTSAFHMRRSLMIFKKAGVPVVPYPANYFNRFHGFGIIDFVPVSENINKWDFYTKEIVGYVVNYFR